MAPRRPPAGVSYPLVLRGSGHSWRRSAAGVLLALALYVVLTPAVSSLVTGLGYLIERPVGGLASYLAAGVRFQTPVGMLAQNLAIASLIPVACFLAVAVHQTRPSWLSSVQPGLRWRYLLICFGVSALILNAVALLTPMVVQGGTGSAGLTVQPQQAWPAFLAVILLTSPLQAAAEEYLFRGYLLQAFGSLAVNPWFGVVASSSLFALFHGGQNLPLFLNRFAFGLLAATLVLKTGGLEAAIGAHIANNISAYSLAALTASIADLRAGRGISWIDSATNVGGFALVTVATLLVSRLLGLRTHTPPADRARPIQEQ